MVRLGGIDRAVRMPKANAAVRRSQWSPCCIHNAAVVPTTGRPGHGRAACDIPLFRDFAGLGSWDDRLPTRPPSCDSAMCWRSTSWPVNPGHRQPAAGRQGPDAAQRHGGRCHADLSAQARPRTPAVDGPEMRQSKKGQPSGSSAYEAHIGVDADLRSGPHRARHIGQRQRCGRSQQFAARARDGCLR